MGSMFSSESHQAGLAVERALEQTRQGRKVVGELLATARPAELRNAHAGSDDRAPA